MHIFADLEKGFFRVGEAWTGTTILCLQAHSNPIGVGLVTQASLSNQALQETCQSGEVQGSSAHQA